MEDIDNQVDGILDTVCRQFGDTILHEQQKMIFELKGESLRK